VNVIKDAEAARFHLPGTEFTALAAPSRGSADLCTWRITVAPGQVADQSHTLDRDEIFMVTAGTIQLTAGGELLGPGDAAVVPAGSPIEVANPGDEPAQAYVAIRAGFTATMADGTTIGTPPWAQ
jgi:mannose-6-phosphate isomerase-like protein (cupin superfamily)